MKETVYEIFRECFPEYPMPSDIFFDVLTYDKCMTLTVAEGDIITGVAVISDNYIRLLCVRSAYQGKGYGRQLLEKCEEKIKADGYEEVVLGGLYGLFQGAVTTEADWNRKSNPFFEKCGYIASNGCFEMKMATKDFDISQIAIEIPDDVTFGYYTDSDRSKLQEAIRDVDEEWVQYFSDTDQVFCAFRGDKIASFAIVGANDSNVLSKEGANIGTIGCVGTVHSERRRGSGLAMVAIATEELKQAGCDTVFIHHTTLDTWYGKLGYYKFMWYWLGKKALQ